MHITYAPENVDFWIDFYKGTISTNPQYQIGGELQGFKAYAPYHVHRGAGLGSFFKSIYRWALPILKYAGKEALASGSRVAADLAQGRNIKSSLTEHGRNAASSILHETADHVKPKRQTGEGLGTRKRAKRVVKTVKRKRPRKNAPFRKRKASKAVGSDIFGRIRL